MIVERRTRKSRWLSCLRHFGNFCREHVPARYRARRLCGEPLESRLLLASLVNEDGIVLDFLWPAGGNNGLTYERHAQYRDAEIDPTAGIDINQDVERSDLAGGTLDTGKFDEDDLGAPAFAAHDGVAIVHALGSPSEDKGFGHSVEVVAFDQRGYDSRDPSANRLFSTLYSHLQEPLVSTGQPIKLGQIVGRIGGSGRANLDEYLPHMHFEFQDSQRDAVSVTASLAGPDHQRLAGPVRFYKGMLQSAPAHQLSASTVLYGPERRAGDERSSVTIAAVRPDQRLHVNMKGFDWDEVVSVRITDATGAQAVPYRDPQGVLRETVRTAPENDEDITEGDASFRDEPDLSLLFGQDGLYYVQALERNRDVGWGTETDRAGVTHGSDVPPGASRTVPFATWNQRVGWAQLDWASESNAAGYPRGPDADAVNLAVLVSPFAPPTGIEGVVRADRLGGVPWRILPDRTLVITGTDAADSISVVSASHAGSWTLTWNGTSYTFHDGEFTSVFVDGGEGDDGISLEDLPAAIGASVFGRGGDDVIHGGRATDFLVGGTGSDSIAGGPGEDWIFGGEGDDRLRGHLEGDVAEAVVDHLFGERGGDELFVDADDEASGGTALGWQHPVNRWDVTNDGQVAPLDVLAVVNEINAPKYCDGSGRLPRQRPVQAFFYDSNGDGHCSPVGDVLPIINFLNDPGSSAEGERSRGPAASSTADPVEQFLLPPGYDTGLQGLGDEFGGKPRRVRLILPRRAGAVAEWPGFSPAAWVG